MTTGSAQSDRLFLYVDAVTLVAIRGDMWEGHLSYSGFGV